MHITTLRDYESVCPKVTFASTWPVIIRWFLFLPLGVLACSLSAAIIRLVVLRDTPFLAELLVNGIEPVVFVYVSNQIIPNYNRPVCIMLLGLQISFRPFTILVLATMVQVEQEWADYTWSFAALSTSAVMVAVLAKRPLWPTTVGTDYQELFEKGHQIDPMKGVDAKAMSDFTRMKRPWAWLAACAAAWGIGLFTTFVAFSTVFLWQSALYPPEQVHLDEFLAEDSFAYQLKS